MLITNRWLDKSRQSWWLNVLLQIWQPWLRLWGRKSVLSHWLCLTLETINQSFQHQNALLSACALISSHIQDIHDVALLVTQDDQTPHPHPHPAQMRDLQTRAHVDAKCQLVKTARTPPATCFNEVWSISANITASFQGDLNVEGEAAFREIHNTQIHVETILWAVRNEVCVAVRFKC